MSIVFNKKQFLSLFLGDVLGGKRWQVGTVISKAHSCLETDQEHLCFIPLFIIIILSTTERRLSTKTLISHNNCELIILFHETVTTKKDLKSRVISTSHEEHFLG